MKRGPVVAFLGPSLPAREARKLLPGCLVLPPARQGDLWRALSLRPRAIALVDGVFESQPSVWHHEVLAALDAGVRVVGGASMGALRAAELHGQGMEGAGRIFAWYRDGTLRDDAEVALLHADAEHGFRPLTVPLVNVRWALSRARAGRMLTAAEERAVVAAAERIFYQERSWPRVLAAARELLPARAHQRFAALVARGPPDLKAADARAVLRLAARDLPAPRQSEVRPAPAPAHVRRRRIAEASSLAPGRAALPNAQILLALSSRGDAGALAAQGLRTLLLAHLARSLGLAPSPAQVEAAEARWLSPLGVPRAERAAFFAASGLAQDDARALCEDLALEALALGHAASLFPDGPAETEGLALEARLRGHWAQLARTLSKRVSAKAR